MLDRILENIALTHEVAKTEMINTNTSVVLSYFVIHFGRYKAAARHDQLK